MQLFQEKLLFANDGNFVNANVVQVVFWFLGDFTENNYYYFFAFFCQNY